MWQGLEFVTSLQGVFSALQATHGLGVDSVLVANKVTGLPGEKKTFWQTEAHVLLAFLSTR